MPVKEVKPGRVKFEVRVRGSLEPSRALQFQSQVEGRTSIVSLRPDGSRVKKGELVCELDSTAFKRKLISQTITIKSAEAAYKKAKLAREAADIALREYVDGALEQERLTLKMAITNAASGVQRANTRVDRARNVQDRVKEALGAKGGAATPADMVAELLVDEQLESALMTREREQSALEEAKAKRQVLEKYTSKKKTAELKSEIEHRRSDELARLAALQTEKTEERFLRQQIENCTIYASFVGYLVLDFDHERKEGDFRVAVGSSVRQWQHIFSLLDLDSPLRLNTKVPESHVELVAPGQRASITFEAIPEQKMAGVVKEVAALPDPTNFFEPKMYTVHVDIDMQWPRLRAGMQAQVEILIPELDNVLTVPWKAMLNFDDKNHLAVKKPEGGFAWREVAIGQSDDKIAVIKQGLKSGDVVSLDPLALMSDEEKRQKFGTPPGGK
jgi:multidrug resistance efflux pump